MSIHTAGNRVKLASNPIEVVSISREYHPAI